MSKGLLIGVKRQNRVESFLFDCTISGREQYAAPAVPEVIPEKPQKREVKPDAPSKPKPIPAPPPLRRPNPGEEPCTQPDFDPDKKHSTCRE